MAYPVWMDVDTGTDDALAILLAHSLEEIEIVGLSAVSGNTELHHSFRNTRAICALLGGGYPVYAGAPKPLFREPFRAPLVHGSNGLGDVELPLPQKETVHEEAAWDALYQEAKKQGGRLRVIATGPLTNLATAFAKYPDLPGLIHTLLIMGGCVSEGNVTPSAEFNIYADPEAAEAVFLSGPPIVLCPLDVTESLYLTPDDMRRMRDDGGEAAGYAYDILQKPWSFHRSYGHPGAQMHDSCPVLYLVHPELFTGKEAGVYVETKGRLTYGKTVTDLYSDRKFDRKNALVVLEAKTEECIEILIRGIQSI
ncbi:MAG: nucleoside hydrolase [Lachnospiraceae bacterium]|nr:nucleoside hydrolase [Lachnospiraceae bacterium]